MKTQKKVKAEATIVTEPVIYIGPTLRGIVAKGTIFKNGFSDAVNVKIAECPSFAELFVPVSQAGAALSDIKKHRGSIFAFYIQVINHFFKEE